MDNLDDPRRTMIPIDMKDQAHFEDYEYNTEIVRADTVIAGSVRVAAEG